MNARRTRLPLNPVTLLGALPLLAPAALAAHPQPQEIPFEELGQAFLEAYCPEDAGAASCKLQDVIDAHFATVRLGAFELAFPLEFFKDKRSTEIQVVAGAMLESQAEWVARFGTDASKAEAAKAELDALAAWVEGWKKSDLSSVAKGDGGKLIDLLEADDAVRTASEQLAPRLFDAGAMAIVPRLPDGIQVLYTPTRLEFMHFVGYSGLADPALKDLMWQPGVNEWTQFWIGNTMIVALQYSPWGDDPNFKTGLSMNKFDKDGQRQHVVQQAASALLASALDRRDMVLFEKGLAVHMTVAICGRANTIDGEGAISSTGATTAPYERFVPGGNPNGGFLPAIPAAGFDSILESRWRKGSDGELYTKALKLGQKLGAKRAKKDNESDLAKNALAHFELKAGSGKKIAVTAPFLGSLAKAKPYPEGGYLNDYREFYRSYQAGFLDWLRVHGTPEPADAEAKFNQMLAKVCTTKDNSLDDVVAEVYGEPLTTTDASAGLEWRFLAWLAEQK